MNTLPTPSNAALNRGSKPGMIGSMTAAIGAFFVVVPAVAQEALMSASEHAALRRPLDLGVEPDIGIWSLAMLGPAAMIMVVAGLGLTITLRSLRADVRRQLVLDGYWQRRTRPRAASAMHG
jgi:hypothetical protein